MRSYAAEQTEGLLGAIDPFPAEIVNGSSNSPIALICEHAGRAIPSALGDLGLSPSQMERHIAYDIGAENVARSMADRLGAPLVLQPYSRLVVDCNRPVHAPDAIPVESDRVAVPGNLGLDAAMRQQRFDEIFVPFHDTVAGVLDGAPRKAVFAIHSFTPVLGSQKRHWDLAFLYRKDTVTSPILAAAAGRLNSGLRIGINEPYTIDDIGDWSIPCHGERRGLSHSLIEIRNDHLGSEAACRAWADLLCAAIEQYFHEARK